MAKNKVHVQLLLFEGGKRPVTKNHCSLTYTMYKPQEGGSWFPGEEKLLDMMLPD